MKKADIYEIAIRITGIYLLVTSIYAIEYLLVSLLGFFQQSGAGEYDQHIYLLLLPLCNIALLVGAAAFLLFKAKYIINKICSSSDFAEDVKLFVTPSALYEIALCIAGLFTIINALPDLFPAIKNYIEAEKFRTPFEKGDAGAIWKSVTRILIGVLVVLFAKQLSGFFGKKIASSEVNSK
jgi:hypothetical protein